MEKYIPHKCSEQLPDRIDFINLSDDGDGLRITVIPTSYTVDLSEETFEIVFGRSFAYRNLDEGIRMKTYDLVKAFPKVPIFTVENSLFIQYFHEESLGAFNDLNIVHYYISTTDDCIDVLSREAPTISRKHL